MESAPDDGPRVLEEIARHYETVDEQGRLGQGKGVLEYTRTMEILERYLPAPPADLLDVGGGAGVYAFALARAGYRVRLVDPIRKHIDQASARAAEPGAPRLERIELGDARRLSLASGSVDAVLMLGPLYHLIRRDERVSALREARRVLRPGGVVAAAAISRFASLLDGLRCQRLSDPQFWEIVGRDLRDGQHRNPTNHPEYFTTAYFHRPDEIGEELAAAGFAHETTLAVEGAGWLIADLDRHWADAKQREVFLEALRRVEAEPALLGVSAHILGIGSAR